MSYSDTRLVTTIVTALNGYQETLIAQVATGRTQEQSIEPTVWLSLDELKRLTNRSRCRQAFIDKIIGMLEDAGLQVEYEDGEGLSVTKPADNLPETFDSLEELLETIDELTPASKAA